MRPEDIVRHRRRDPFEPFRLHVSDGSSYEIRQQWGTMIVTQGAVVIGVDPDEDGFPQRIVYVGPKAITSLEPIADTSAQK